MNERRIAHLDMDAFFAAVELLRRPQLRGRPLIVGGRPDPAGSGYAVPTGRGVVMTASYEARRFGVRSGMPLRQAAERCPEAIYVPTDFDEYRRVSRLFKRAVAELAPRIEDRGIDEVYIDLTAVPGAQIEQGAAVAREIKHNVFAATGLTCSIGIAPNKLLAKIASELDKPDGLTIIGADDLHTKVWPLSVKRINGVGPKMSAKLAELQILTIGDLASRERAWLIGRFGAGHGGWLHDAAHGRDERPVAAHAEPKSRSRETTFARDLHPLRDRAALDAVIHAHSAHLARALAQRGYGGKTVGLKVRFDDFTTLTREQTLPAVTADAQIIEAAARRCLVRVPLKRRIRLLGVRMGHLRRLDDRLAAASSAAETAPLFEEL